MSALRNKAWVSEGRSLASRFVQLLLQNHMVFEQVRRATYQETSSIASETKVRKCA